MSISSSIKSAADSARASAALPAAGAYDLEAAAIAIDVERASTLELYVTYTRGAAGGACKFKVSVSNDGTNYFERTVVDGGSLAAGALKVYTAELQLPVAAGAGAERRTYALDVRTAGWVKVLFAEYGATGTPGVVAAAFVAGS